MRWLMVGTCGLLIASWVLASEDKEQKGPSEMVLHVVENESGAVVEGAQISAVVRWAAEQRTDKLTTDANGRAMLPYPKVDGPFFVEVRIEHAGHVPYNITRYWTERAELPSEKTALLVKGQSIGGRVVDPQGHPIAGARISLHYRSQDGPEGNRFDIFAVETDQDGLWKTDFAPLDLQDRHLRIEHADYLYLNARVQGRMDNRYELDPGLKMKGRVTDASGTPIENVQVTFEYEGRNKFPRQPVLTGANGDFELRTLSKFTTFVVAQKEGYGPAMGEGVPDDGSQSVDLQLAAGRTTRFEVRDAATDLPIANARVRSMVWQKSPTLQLALRRWFGRTDDQGRTEWSDAPAEPVLFLISHDDYAWLQDFRAQPREEPHVLWLHRPSHVIGIVTDEQKAKVPKFEVSIRYEGGRQQGREWWRHNQGRDGQFDLKTLQVTEKFFVRIAADGYEPWISPALEMSTAEHRLFVKLKAKRAE